VRGYGGGFCSGFCLGVVVLEMEKEIELYGGVLMFVVDKIEMEEEKDNGEVL